MVNLGNIFRKKIKGAKHSFYAGKIGYSSDALILINVSFLLAIYIALFWLLAFIIAPINETLSLIVCGTLSVCVLLFCRIKNLFSPTLPISAKILFKLYGKYGYCVSKKDWDTIKEKSLYVYKFLNSKKSFLMISETNLSPGARKTISNVTFKYTLTHTSLCPIYM